MLIRGSWAELCNKGSRFPFAPGNPWFSVTCGTAYHDSHSGYMKETATLLESGAHSRKRASSQGHEGWGRTRMSQRTKEQQEETSLQMAGEKTSRFICPTQAAPVEAQAKESDSNCIYTQPMNQTAGWLPWIHMHKGEAGRTGEKAPLTWSWLPSCSTPSKGRSWWQEMKLKCGPGYRWLKSLRLRGWLLFFHYNVESEKTPWNSSHCL